MKDRSLKRHGRITSTRLNSTTIAFLIMAPVVALFYGTFVFNPSNADHMVLYIMHVGADLISILVFLGLWITVFLDVFVEQHHRPAHVEKNGFFKTNPTIDIIIPTAGEEVAIVRKTVAAAIAMEYPHKTYVLDDGQSPAIKRMALKEGATYIRRRNREGAKAGNVNHGLGYCKGDFFAIIDADHVPKSNFIIKLLPYMEDEKIALVQSPQHYTNTDEFIAAGTAQAQDVFYKYVLPAKNISNSAFCVGTNMIFRRAAIDEVGGIAMNHSEDIWTTLKLHQGGWRSIFINESLAWGKAPSTIPSFFKQQRRWARGGFDMLLHTNPLRVSNLNLDQKLQYFISNMFWLVGFAVLAYMLFPIIFLLLGIKPLRTDQGLVWAVHYLPYFIMYYSLAMLLVGRMKIETISTSVASFYPHILAFFSSLLNIESTWTATGASKPKNDYLMFWIWPHVLLITLTIFGFIIGWYNPYDFWTTIFNTVWAAANLYFLLVFLVGSRRKAAVQA